MRLIPVIDVRGGIAVHAVAGQRALYQPLESVLVPGHDPLLVAASLHQQLAITELYVADLDAIEAVSQSRPQGLSLVVAGLATWAEGAGVTLLLDAGVSSAPAALILAGYAAIRVVVGTETLTDLGALQAIISAVGRDRVTSSLDLREEQVLTVIPELAGCTPEQAAVRLADQGVAELIMIDLARVGTSTGPRASSLHRVVRDCPDLPILLGGGVRNAADLEELPALGVAGALVATALHRGAITPQEWRRHV